MTHDIEQAARKFVHQVMGTALDEITLLPREDRLRIEVPEGNFHISEVMQTLNPRLDNRYHISLGRHYVELFEPPGQAEVAGRPPLCGQDIMADMARRVAEEEAAMLQTLRDALPGASASFRAGLVEIVRAMERTGPQRFLGGGPQNGPFRPV